MIEIRPLRDTDSIGTITQLLHNAYARLGSMGLNYTAVDQTDAVTRQRFAGGQGFVAIQNNTLVGTIVVQPSKVESPCEYYRTPSVAAIHQYAVDPTRQGLGIGRALMEQCEHWAKQHGFSEIALDTAEQATHLIELYTRRGYSRCGWVQWEGKSYRSTVMSKRLVY